jgi:hypothetical protein
LVRFIAALKALRHPKSEFAEMTERRAVPDQDQSEFKVKEEG